MILNKPLVRIAVVAALVISILLGVWFTVGSSLTTTAQSSNGNLLENEISARVEDLSHPFRPYLMVTRENIGGEIKTKLDYVLSTGRSYHGEIPSECLTAMGVGNIVLHIDDTSTIPGMPQDVSIHVEWNQIPGPWCSIVYWETWHYPEGSIESSRYTEKVYPAEAQGTIINWTLDGIDEQAEIRRWQAIE
jgi:hypothetical protein